MPFSHILSFLSGHLVFFPLHTVYAFSSLSLPHLSCLRGALAIHVVWSTFFVFSFPVLTTAQPHLDDFIPRPHNFTTSRPHDFMASRPHDLTTLRTVDKTYLTTFLIPPPLVLDTVATVSSSILGAQFLTYTNALLIFRVRFESFLYTPGCASTRFPQTVVGGSGAGQVWTAAINWVCISAWL